MKLQELIEQLTEALEELGPNAQIRIAMQPHYPLDAHVERISTIHPKREEIEDLREILRSEELSDEDREQIGEQISELEATPRILWICQGSSVGYTTRRHWHE